MSIAPSAGNERQSTDGANGSPFFDTGEAARYLRLELRTLVNWRSRGGGPRYRKHGGHVVYHVADLDAWSRGQSRGPAE